MWQILQQFGEPVSLHIRIRASAINGILWVCFIRKKYSVYWMRCSNNNSFIKTDKISEIKIDYLLENHLNGISVPVRWRIVANSYIQQEFWVPWIWAGKLHITALEIWLSWRIFQVCNCQSTTFACLWLLFSMIWRYYQILPYLLKLDCLPEAVYSNGQ